MRCAIWIVVVAACGGSDSPSGPTIRFALSDSGVPAPLAVPWPSDIYIDTDGTVVEGLTDWSLAGLDESEPSAMLSQYGALDGFGLQAGIVFGVDGLEGTDTIDPASLTPDRFVLVDVDAGAPVPCGVGYDAFAHAIVLVPDDVLAPGKRYAAGMLAGPAVAGGQPLAASAGFLAVRDNDAAPIYGDAINALVDHGGVDRSQLIAATGYTTSTDNHGAFDTAARLYAGAYGPPPQLVTTNVVAPYRSTRFGRTTHAGWTATLEEWMGAARKGTDGADLAGMSTKAEGTAYGYPHDAIAAIVTGTIGSPQFPRPFAMTAAYDDGTTAYDGSGNAIAADPTAQIPVVIVVPAGAAPAAGFPVVMFQHGLGGDRTTAFAIANELARSGIATVAIDAPLHGMRDPTASDIDSNGIGTYKGPDGFADGANPLVLLDVVGGLRSMLRTRDILWQFSFDLVQLRRMIDVVDLTPVADEFGGVAPTFDASHVGFIGWSLGGLAGTTFNAITGGDRVDPVVLVSPASNIALLFADSPVYAAESGLIAAAADIHPPSLDAGRYSALLQLLEGLVTTADTGGFAPTLAGQHDVWLLIGGEDESVTHRSSDQLARALGATQILPALRMADGVSQAASPLGAGASGRVAGYYEVAPGNHSHTFERFTTIGYEPPYPRPSDPPFVPLPTALTIRQTTVGEQRAIAAYMHASWLGTPSISVTDPSFIGLAPVQDLDDDGFCDADEIAAGTDPFNAASKPAGAPTCPRDVGF